MAHTSFELDTFIDAPPATVRDFLAKLENHLKIHPLIVAVQHDSTTIAEDGIPVQHYHITDHMKLGPFTIKFTYRVTSKISSAAELISEAFQSPRIYLHNTTSFHAEGSGTRLKESVTIDAPQVLMGTVYKQAIQSHRESLAKLTTLFGQAE